MGYNFCSEIRSGSFLNHMICPGLTFSQDDHSSSNSILLDNDDHNSMSLRPIGTNEQGLDISNPAGTWLCNQFYCSGSSPKSKYFQNCFVLTAVFWWFRKAVVYIAITHSIYLGSTPFFDRRCSNVIVSKHAKFYYNPTMGKYEVNSNFQYRSRLQYHQAETCVVDHAIPYEGNVQLQHLNMISLLEFNCA